MFLLCCAWATLSAQPERLNYFPDTGRSYAQLDPGDELLLRNVLISNQAPSYNISFSLSFDKETWRGFAIGPRYSSIFSLNNLDGCFIRVRTKQADKIEEVEYYLLRGNCYSVYWNTSLLRWDVVEIACRRE